MDNKMEDYYKVLQYLRESHVDRQYPYEFADVEQVTPTEQCELVEDYHSDFDFALKVTEIAAGQKIRLHLTSPRDYNDIDTFEILFYSNETITPADIEIGFSNTRNGVANQVELKQDDVSDEDKVINEDGYHQFRYLVRKTNTKMQKKNRAISSVYCINLKFNKPVTEFYLSNFVARTDQFTITLEDLDEQIVMGKNYVMNKLRAYSWDEIPPQLEHLSFKCAAAYSWLVFWENQGKTMGDGTQLSRNYADRLFAQIDTFIENYMASNGYGDPNLRLLGWTEWCNVDPNCKSDCKNNRTRYYRGNRLI